MNVKLVLAQLRDWAQLRVVQSVRELAWSMNGDPQILGWKCCCMSVRKDTRLTINPKCCCMSVRKDSKAFQQIGTAVHSLSGRYKAVVVPTGVHL